MYNYSFISLTAFLCYLTLFVAFAAARKDKIINSFLPVLIACIVWTGGSFAMRGELWPGIDFWFHVTLLGLFFVPYYFFCFICSMLDFKERAMKSFFFWLTVFHYFINLCTGIYIPDPELIRLLDGSACFVFHIGWSGLLLLVMMFLPILRILYLIQASPEAGTKKEQLFPVFAGLFVLALGHIGMLLPAFSCFPLDMISGVANAGLLFYALYKKRLFCLDFLVSRGVVYGICLVFAAVLSANYVDLALDNIHRYAPDLEDRGVLILAVCFALATFVLAAAVKAFIDRVFIKEEFIRSENLKNFSRNVSKSLKVEDIVKEITAVIGETLKVEAIHVCVIDKEGTGYQFISEEKPDSGLFLSDTDPAVSWLETTRSCFIAAGQEKKYPVLERLEAGCMVPMIAEDDLAGIIFLGNRKKNRQYGGNEMNFLESIGSIASIAVRNSRLYEQAYMEARQDELTGLLNRKYFYKILNEVYDQNPGAQLSIIIFNIDDFKLYNQLYGIREGDAALQKTAEIIRKNVADKGYTARYSGKEFAAALPECGIVEAKEIAEAIRGEILELNSRGSDALMKSLTMSCGICAIPDSANNVKQLVENADMAVFSVKQRGKNGVMVYDFNAHSAMEKGQQPKANRKAYSTYRSTIYALTAAIDTKDHYTFSHSNHVAEYAGELAREYGMSEDFVELVKEAGLLHDIGKIGIPEHILNKTDRLEPDEYEIMKGHVEASIRIIRNLPSLDYVIPAVIGHHERYDGKGYPRGIVGEDIPLSARILCIVDSFDAMISKRSYKDERSVEYALNEILKNAGKQFDPKLAPLFVKAVEEGRIKPAQNMKS